MFDESNSVPLFISNLLGDGNDVPVDDSVKVCVPTRLIGTAKMQVPPDILTCNDPFEKDASYIVVISRVPVPVIVIGARKGVPAFAVRIM
jgi:hypothetical protein